MANEHVGLEPGDLEKAHIFANDILAAVRRRFPVRTASNEALVMLGAAHFLACSIAEMGAPHTAFVLVVNRIIGTMTEEIEKQKNHDKG